MTLDAQADVRYRVRVIGKVMDVESTRILAAFSFDVFLPKDVRTRCAPAVLSAEGPSSLVKAENPNSDYRIRVWTDKAVYKLGEPVTIYAQSNRDGYLYLFDIDSQGSKTLILPNTYSRQHHFLAAGETFRSPAGWFSAGRPTGRGTIKAVVTPDPLPLDDPTFSDLSSGVPFRSLSRASARGVVVNTRKTEGGFGTGWISIEE